MLPFATAEKNAIKPTPLSIMFPVHPAFWKVLSAVLLLCLLVQEISLRRTSSLRPALEDKSSLNIATANSPWVFNWERDANNHGLSTKQCHAAFPDLWSELERSEQHWSGRQIAPEDVELHEANDGGVRVLIAHQKLRIIQTKGLFRRDFRTRIIAVLSQLQRSIVAAEHTGEAIPDMEFSIIVDDIPVLAGDSGEHGAPWAFTRAYADPLHDNIWLIPDFHFWAAPPEAEPWEISQAMAKKHDAPLQEKRPEVIWRGVKWTNEELRQALINITDGKPWANAKFIDWKKPFDKMPMDGFCKYRFTINTEGRSWSARLANLLNCDSLLMVHDVGWVAHFYHLLDTGVNCVRVERDFTDLEEKVAYYNKNLDEAQLIADEARKTFRERYITPAATACYWRKLMRTWASVAFKPEITISAKKEGGEKMHHLASGLRGTSFEEFIEEDNTQDYPQRLKHKHHHQHQGRPNVPGKPKSTDHP